MCILCVIYILKICIVALKCLNIHLCIYVCIHTLTIHLNLYLKIFHYNRKMVRRNTKRERLNIEKAKSCPRPLRASDSPKASEGLA